MIKRETLLWTVLAVTWLGGCASMTPPEDRIAAAELQIRKAEDGLAAQHAPLDLLKAREKYEAARAAMRDGDYEAARRLAEQAAVDARLAEEKARTARAQQMAREMKASVETLRREAERYGTRPSNGGARQLGPEGASR